MDDVVVRTRKLTKRYGSKRGIDEVDLEVRRGDVFGFLGPNGAGKTTTIRLLLDLLRPTSGQREVFGLDATRHAREIQARVGYLPGEAGLAERMTVAQQLQYFGSLRGGVPWERVEAYAQRLDLDLTRHVRKLSRGNKQKVGLVQAFMHEPELLILDEPTSGLDPLMQQEFNAMVRDASARGATVFLSSHVLSEVELLCDRVAIIRDGRIVATEDVRSLKAKALREIRAKFAQTPRLADIERVAGVASVRVEGDEVILAVRGEVGPAIRALAAAGDLRDLTAREAALEDVFLGYYAEASA